MAGAARVMNCARFGSRREPDTGHRSIGPWLDCRMITQNTRNEAKAQTLPPRLFNVLWVYGPENSRLPLRSNPPGSTPVLWPLGQQLLAQSTVCHVRIAEMCFPLLILLQPRVVAYKSAAKPRQRRVEQAVEQAAERPGASPWRESQQRLHGMRDPLISQNSCWPGGNFQASTM